MFDFPNTPTIGQTVTAQNGVVYLWDGTKWVAGTGASSAALAANVGRNVVHNPYFNIAQRGIGAFTANGAYTLDRWKIAASSDVVSFGRGTLGDSDRVSIGDEAATYYLQNQFTGNAAAAAFSYIVQPIEDIRRLAGKTVAVSFWANGYAGLKLGVNVVQQFGTGGSPSAGAWSQTTGASVTLTTTMTRYSVNIVIPNMQGKTLGTNGDHYNGLGFFYSSGATANAIAGNIGVQSGIISLWGIQCEVGSVATPLEHIDPRMDLANCLRFYEIGSFYLAGAAGSASSGCGYIQPFAVPKRAVPIITTSGTATANMSSTAVNTEGNFAIQPYGVTAAVGGYYWVGNFTASADL